MPLFVNERLEKILKPILILCCFGTILTGCEQLAPALPEESDVLDGPMEDLSAAQLSRFIAGDEAFGEVFTPETGLGPYFVTSSCASCHVGDGKGHPFSTLTRFGTTSNGQFDPLLNLGGPQLQHRAIPGFEPEHLPDAANGISRLTPPAVTGLGLLEAIPDELILELSDPDDMDGDGISGRPNYVYPPDYFSPGANHLPDAQGRYIGRFGKKAAAINLLHQTVNAYKQDMGITSEFDMIDPINFAVSDMPLDDVEDPELSTSTLLNVVFYLQTLKAPIQRNSSSPETDLGKQVFLEIGCESCHKSTLQTGDSHIAALANKVFHPYTDLLLHDMGDELNDNYTEGIAENAEWRTPALWGLGLSQDAQGGRYFLMHDGRASSIEEAIVMHGGEATQSKENYEALSSDDRARLIQFLESL